MLGIFGFLGFIIILVFIIIFIVLAFLGNIVRSIFGLGNARLSNIMAKRPLHRTIMTAILLPKVQLPLPMVRKRFLQTMKGNM